MAGSFGTNYPYSAGDVLNVVSTNGQVGGAFRVILHGTDMIVAGTSTARASIVPAGTAFILHSVSAVGSGATGTTTGTVTTGLAAWKNLDIFVDVTAEAGAATTTLFIFVDGHSPNTATFVNLACFPAITTVGKHIVHLTKEKSALTTASIQIDAGLGTVRSLGWGDGLRIRTQLTGTADTVVSATVYVYNQVA